MHAFLIINSNPEDFARKQNAKILPFVLQKIEDARELKKFVKFSFSEKTAIIIENIDTATIETANAFLKNLEEPNNNLIYILTASNLENVLPTIVSRCQVIKAIQVKQVLQVEQESKDFLDIKDRGEAIEFLKNIIRIEHINNNFKNQQNYLNTIKNLKANGNVSLQLLNLVVKMSNHG